MTRTLALELANLGNAGTWFFTVAIELQGPVSGTQEQIVLSLPPYTSEWLTFSLPGLISGKYEVVATIDAENQVVESRECNNQAKMAFVVPTDLVYLPIVASRHNPQARQNSAGQTAMATPAGRLTRGTATYIPGFREFPVPTANSHPAKLILDSQGRVWTTERDGNKLARYDPDTASWDEYAIPTPHSKPWGLDLDANGNVWFAESAPAANKIGMLDLSADPVPLFAEYPVPTPASQPWNLVVGDDGTVWFTERAGNKIGKLVPGVGVTTEYPVPTQSAEPSGIGIHRFSVGGRVYNYLYFTEAATSKLGQLNASNGEILERRLVSNSRPEELVMTPSGDVWWSETGANRVVLFQPSTLSFALELDVPTPSAEPYGIALDGGTAVWFTERAANKLGRFSGALPLSEYTLPNPNSQPLGIAVDSVGCAWYAASGANKIGRFCPLPTFPTYLPLTSKG
jgi:virginiamycin B lyase